MENFEVISEPVSKETLEDRALKLAALLRLSNTSIEIFNESFDSDIDNCSINYSNDVNESISQTVEELLPVLLAFTFEEVKSDVEVDLEEDNYSLNIEVVDGKLIFSYSFRYEASEACGDTIELEEESDAELFEYLKENNVKSFVLNFSGGGDSGGVDNCEGIGTDGKPLAQVVVDKLQDMLEDRIFSSAEISFDGEPSVSGSTTFDFDVFSDEGNPCLTTNYNCYSSESLDKDYEFVLNQ